MQTTGTLFTTLLLVLASLTSAAPTTKRQVNVQSFGGQLGGPATPVEFTAGADRPFSVNGDTFTNFAAAAARSCDQQFNRCANAANGGQGISFSDCESQKVACFAAQQNASPI